MHALREKSGYPVSDNGQSPSNFYPSLALVLNSCPFTTFTLPLCLSHILAFVLYSLPDDQCNFSHFSLCFPCMCTLGFCYIWLSALRSRTNMAGTPPPAFLGRRSRKLLDYKFVRAEILSACILQSQYGVFHIGTQ